MDMEMETNSTPSLSGGSQNETSPYIMYEAQQQIRNDSLEKVMSEYWYKVLVPGTCPIPVVLVYRQQYAVCHKSIYSSNSCSSYRLAIRVLL